MPGLQSAICLCDLAISAISVLFSVLVSHAREDFSRLADLKETNQEKSYNSSMCDCLEFDASFTSSSASPYGKS